MFQKDNESNNSNFILNSEEPVLDSIYINHDNSHDNNNNDMISNTTNPPHFSYNMLPIIDETSIYTTNPMIDTIFYPIHEDPYLNYYNQTYNTQNSNDNVNNINKMGVKQNLMSYIKERDSEVQLTIDSEDNERNINNLLSSSNNNIYNNENTNLNYYLNYNNSMNDDMRMTEGIGNNQYSELNHRGRGRTLSEPNLVHYFQFNNNDNDNDNEPKGPKVYNDRTNSLDNNVIITNPNNPIIPKKKSVRRGSLASNTGPQQPHICVYESCKRVFKRPEHLKRHYQSLHTSYKPYACTHCQKRFARSDNLNQHLKIHVPKTNSK